MIQTALNKQQSAKPKVKLNTSENLQRHQYIDVISLMQHNAKLAQRPEIAPRMDREDRLAYIKQQKEKLGLNDNVMLKSSKRAIVDGQLRKDMPSLEFN